MTPLTQPLYRPLLRGAVGAVINLVTVLVLVFLLGPIVVVLIIAFSADAYLSFPPSGLSLRWFETFFQGDPSWMRAFWRSLSVALPTAILAVVLGTPAALAIARLRFKGRAATEYLLLAPLLISPMITAIGLYGQFASLHIIGTTVALVLGHAVLALPFVVMNVAVSARSLDMRLEQAAMSLGARPRTVLRRITLPLLAPGMIAAAFFAFLVSFDEAIVSLFLSGLDPTLQKRMWDDIRLEISPTVAAASVVLIAITLLGFALAALALRRGRRASRPHAARG